MLSQGPEKENNSEEIYQLMIEEVFDFHETEKDFSKKKFLGSGFSNQIMKDTPSINNILSQRLINAITAQLQSILPGAFRITINHEQCLSRANLQSWSPGRSYYSLFEMKHSRSIWILHLSRSVGERLAFLASQRNTSEKRKVFIDLREADALIYLEIGELLRQVFNSIIGIWPQSENLKVLSCRHVLQLFYLNSKIQEEEYVIIPFNLDNRECSGELHLVFPQRNLLSI